MTNLWRVTAPHFCAGIVTNAEGRVTDAAPILRWCIGKTRPDLRSYFKRKRWTVQTVP